MPVESRNRMISFRLTEEEYKSFTSLCFRRGIRSVSELARSAINIMLTEPGRAVQGDLESRVNELEGRLEALSHELKKLNQRNDQKTVSFQIRQPEPTISE